MLSRGSSRSVSPAGYVLFTLLYMKRDEIDNPIRRLNPPGYRPPAEFVMSTGKKVSVPTYTTGTTRGLNNFYDAITRGGSPNGSYLSIGS